MRGFLFGALALIALETIVQPDASGRVSGLIDELTGLAKHFLDPARPAVTKAVPGDDGGNSLGDSILHALDPTHGLLGI